MNKSIVILEVEGGKGKIKDKDGFRLDTAPILTALVNEDLNAEVVFYKNKKREELFEYFSTNKISAILVRINPRNIKKVDDFFNFLDSLEKIGIKIYTNPSTMLKIHFKDVLVHFSNKPFCTNDVYMYNSHKEFKEKFPNSLMKSRVRILKKNFSSDGDGIWMIRTQDNGNIVATEALDDKKIVYPNLDSFLNDFKNKFDYKDKNATFIQDKLGVIDMKYLAQIIDGEYRVLLVKDKIKHIIHKRPKKESFSTTYFSGASYETKDKNKDKFETLKNIVNNSLKDIKEYINELPVLWSMDFIKDKEKYLLSEINPSCVEITTVLDIAQDLAKAIKEDLGE